MAGEPQIHAGFCAIVGRPNVGKSTLLNRALGQKLVAVTPKPQTTRNRILGVKNRPGAQIVYVDTPGIHKGRSSLNQYMVGEALAAVGECDVILAIVEAPQAVTADWTPGEGNLAVVAELAKVKRPRILAVNKVDLVRTKEMLLPVLDHYAKLLPWKEIVPISAETGDGVETLEAAIAANLPMGPALYPEEMLTDRAERFLAGELIREQAFLLLGDELPYSLAVTIENFHERAAQKDVVIDAVVHVERESQKKIVVGEGGRMVKDLGMRARVEIAKLLDCPVHLKLFVKVDPDWTRAAEGLRRMGYEK
jgi:GTP-binding protein Era